MACLSKTNLLIWFHLIFIFLKWKYGLPVLDKSVDPIWTNLCLSQMKIWPACPKPHLFTQGWSAKCQPTSFHKSIGKTKSLRKNLERNCESLNLGLVHSIEGKVQHLNMAGQQYVSQHLSKNQSEEQTGEVLVKKLGKVYFQDSNTALGGKERFKLLL